MHRMSIKYTDFKESEILVTAWKFEQSQLVLDHPDFSVEYINRQYIKSVRVWKDDIPV